MALLTLNAFITLDINSKIELLIPNCKTIGVSFCGVVTTYYYFYQLPNC